MAHVTAADVAHVLQKEKTTQRKLSRAALETLATNAEFPPPALQDIDPAKLAGKYEERLAAYEAAK